MSRNIVLRLLALPLFAVLATALWSPHAASAASSADFRMDVEVSPERLMRVKCDGDSMPITVRITRVGDGSPVAGAIVKVGGSVPADAREAVTNRTGIARSEVAPTIPTPQATYPKRSYYVSATVEGVSLFFGPRFYSCPFPEGHFELNARLFVDRNSNGVIDRHDPDFASRETILQFGGDTQQSTLGGRLYDLSRRGTFSTTLFTGGYGAGRGAWVICLTDRQVERGWQIVSLNGVPLEFVYRCATLPQLASGGNAISVGVARTDSSGQE